MHEPPVASAGSAGGAAAVVLLQWRQPSSAQMSNRSESPFQVPSFLWSPSVTVLSAWKRSVPAAHASPSRWSVVSVVSEEPSAAQTYDPAQD